MRRTWTGMVVAASLLLAACGGDTGGTAADDGTATGQAAGESAATTVATADTELGEILVDGDGRTLYLFDSDPDGGTACTGGCAETWPPLAGPAVAEGGAATAQLGTIDRPDGSTQVTYAGHPLYHYAPDAAPGDVTGQGVGGVWWVVAPDGTAVQEGPDEATTGADGSAY